MQEQPQPAAALQLTEIEVLWPTGPRSKRMAGRGPRQQRWRLPGLLGTQHGTGARGPTGLATSVLFSFLHGGPQRRQRAGIASALEDLPVGQTLHCLTQARERAGGVKGNAEPKSG